MQSDHSALGKAVKLARQRKNLSQETLAEILDITPTHLKHIESGHRNPSVDLLFRMARALQMSWTMCISRTPVALFKFSKAQLLLGL